MAINYSLNRALLRRVAAIEESGANPGVPPEELQAIKDRLDAAEAGEALDDSEIANLVTRVSDAEAALGTKANAASLAAKADKSDTYTKAQVDTAVAAAPGKPGPNPKGAWSAKAYSPGDLVTYTDNRVYVAGPSGTVSGDVPGSSIPGIGGTNQTITFPGSGRQVYAFDVATGGTLNWALQGFTGATGWYVGVFSSAAGGSGNKLSNSQDSVSVAAGRYYLIISNDPGGTVQFGGTGTVTGRISVGTAVLGTYVQPWTAIGLLDAALDGKVDKIATASVVYGTAVGSTVTTSLAHTNGATGNTIARRDNSGTLRAADPQGNTTDLVPIGYADARYAAKVARATVTKTTASLATNANESGTVVMGKSFRLLKITTDKPARVRLYATPAQRDADASRAVGTDPTGDHGLLFEFVSTAGLLSQVVTPQVDGSNLEATPSTSIPCTITNLDASSGTVTATLTYIATEV